MAVHEGFEARDVMETTTIKCDNCDADLKYKSNSVEYRLVLVSESKNARPGIQSYTDMMNYPSIDSKKHFCGLRCLGKWVPKQDFRGKERVGRIGPVGDAV